MARWADAAIGARVVEAVPVATHAWHRALVDVCGKRKCDPLVCGPKVTASFSKNLTHLGASPSDKGLQTLLVGHTLAVGAVESLVALGAVSAHLPT